MDTESRRENSTVADQLFDPDESVAFSFFQAVRLLETLAARAPARSHRAESRSVGEDCPPRDEPVRFEVTQSLAFPSSEVVRLEPHQDRHSREKHSTQDSDSPEETLPAVMETAFMGLTGPNGALPHHYTTLVIERLRQNDPTLKHFWDLFNHRFISLFYRAWRKYRLAFAYEKYRQTHSDHAADGFSQLLLSLCGLGTPGLGGRQLVDDETFIYYSGHFSTDHRSAEGLRCLLTDAFDVPAEIEQFQGEWLPLSTEYQSSLPGAPDPGQYMALGEDTVVGARVWSCQHRFRVRLGPLRLARFKGFLPDQNSFRALCQLVRNYVGIEFDFDVQLILHRDDVPATQLGHSPDNGSRLGWNTWMRNPRHRKHAEDAVFQYDGLPHNGRETARQA